MDQTLSNFIAALRNLDVRVSTAETLDALSTVELIGYRSRSDLKNALALVLPKTADEKVRFDECFDEFFAFHAFADSAANDEHPAETGDTHSATEGEQTDTAPAADGAGGSPQAAGGGLGGGGDGPREQDTAALEQTLPPGALAEPTSVLGKALMNSDRTGLALAMAGAAEQVGVRNIAVFTQKGLYTRRILEAMGLGELDAEINAGEGAASLPQRRLSRELVRRREGLREQVRDYVERQFLLHADSDGTRLRTELLRNVKLSNIEQRNYRLIQSIVLRMAKQLATRHARRKTVTKRGQLHVPRTLRHNMAYDGAIFDLKWKSVKIDRPKVFAICDVSGSVANYARFMLMFLYSLEAVLPKVRAFAFSSDLAEVTRLFETHELEEAINITLHDYSGGSTDYGQAFADFHKRCLDQVDKRTTVIVLGDARNNYGDPRADLLKDVYERCRRLIWLNPEPRSTWRLGDSEMARYSAYAHQVEVCNSLMHLERFVGNLLKLAL